MEGEGKKRKEGRRNEGKKGKRERKKGGITQNVGENQRSNFLGKNVSNAFFTLHQNSLFRSREEGKQP